MTEKETLETKARIYDLSVEINTLVLQQQALMQEIERLKALLVDAENEQASPDAA